MRNVFLIPILFSVFFSFVSGQSQDLPNILWIVSEDNSAFIGAYGDEFATTPHIDQLAVEGVLYENAFATAPVCAPARSTLITGVYPTSMGTQHMRSQYQIPEMIRFFPEYLREKGYYTTNNAKKDYNTIDHPEAWDESSNKATYKNRSPGQPFFAIFNIGITHESSIHKSIPNEKLRHDPEQVPIPPYHPPTPEMKHDWAQYYDKVEDMDRKVGDLLAELEASGEADNTIVFYYSDHGGILGRSKRYLFESGLHIPLIIHFPKKFHHLAPNASGTRTDRLVSFVDFAPTLLSLAGVTVPEYMQGKAFLGDQQASPSQYAYGFRGRMDERIDMSRSVRDKQYRYIKNYMPHKIYGQYLEYLWRAPSMQSWAKAYDEGSLDFIQSRFFEPKPVEELYDVKQDPHNINNLAENPAYDQVLKRMRQANEDWMIRIKDVGFIPEAMIEEIDAHTPLYTFARSEIYPVSDIIPRVDAMVSGRISAIKKGIEDPHPVVRYWAATTAGTHYPETSKLIPEIKKLTRDIQMSVRIAAGEALYRMKQPEVAIHVLKEGILDSHEMARLQALNALDLLSHEELKQVLPDIEKLIPEDQDNRDYDVRAARGLVKKAKDVE